MAVDTLRIAATTVFLLALGISPGLCAQMTSEPETVASRQREGLDPLGVRLGSFLFFPDIALQYFRDDNVFATRDDPHSDTAVVIRPSLRLRSGWSRNLLEMGASAAVSKYSSFAEEDHDDAMAFIRGSWDTVNDSFLYTQLRHSVNHEDRESADDQLGLERTKFDRNDIRFGYRFRPGRTLLQLEADLSQLDFEDVAGPGGSINQDDRDRDRRNLSLRAGYDVSDGYSVFLQGTRQEVDYEDQFDDNGFERSGDGYEVVLGTTLSLTNVIFGDVYVGRKSHNFDDARFVDIGGTSFGIDVAWNVTRLTTLTFIGRQEVVPTTVRDASGIDQTRLGLRADHELFRNLILSLGWDSRVDDFKGIQRRDDLTGLRFEARYLISRRMNVEFSFARSKRDSNIVLDREYSKHVASIQIKGQL